LPATALSLADDCAARLAPAWDLAGRNRPAGSRAALRGSMGLAADRTVIAVPLHYEHEENFFLRHAAFPNGAAMIEAMLERLDDDALLAITDHPLNPLHVGRHMLATCLARHTDRVIDCTGPRATEKLVLCADAMVVDLSKSWSLAAFHGLPLIDIGGRLRADWIGAAPGLPAPNAPDRAEARRWFGWHLGTRILHPGAMSVDRLQRTIELRPSDADIDGNIAMVIAHQQAFAEQAAAA